MFRGLPLDVVWKYTIVNQFGVEDFIFDFSVLNLDCWHFWYDMLEMRLIHEVLGFPRIVVHCGESSVISGALIPWVWMCRYRCRQGSYCVMGGHLLTIGGDFSRLVKFYVAHVSDLCHP